MSAADLRDLRVPTAPIHHAPEGTTFTRFFGMMVFSLNSYRAMTTRAFINAEQHDWLIEQGFAFGIYHETRVGDHVVLPYAIDASTFLSGGVMIGRYIGIHDPDAALWYKMRFHGPARA